MRFLILIFSFSLLFSQNINELLKEYAKKNDLSNETKIENRGLLILYTHHDIEKMQALTLKDLLKSIPFLGYKETRYAVPSLLYSGGFFPVGNDVKVYVDDTEIIVPSYSSAFSIYGDIDLGNIDYVEVYYINPSFENYSDSGLYVIKLYTKDPKRYIGVDLKTSFANRGYNMSSIFLSDENKFLYVNRFNDKEKKYNDSSKNQKRYNIFFKYQKYNSQIEFNLVNNSKDVFFANSLDAKPDYAHTNYNFYVLSYMYKSSNLKFKAQYNGGVKHFKSKENPYLFFIGSKPIFSYEDKTSEKAYITDLSYKNRINKNRFIMGLKYNKSIFPHKIFKINNLDKNLSGYKVRDTFTSYLEYQYIYSIKSIIGGGVSYVYLKNYNGPKSKGYFNYKLSYTYNNKKYLYKSFLYKTYKIYAPYLYDFILVDKRYLKSYPNLFIGQSLKRKYKDGYTNLFLYFNKTKATDYKTFAKYINMIGGYISYVKNLNMDNSILSRIEYSKTLNSFKNKHLYERAFYLRYLGKYLDYSFFNEFLMRNTNFVSDKKYYFDLNIGVKRKIKNFIIAFKGVNILNRGFKESVYSIDGYKKFDIDSRKFILSLEYRF